MAPPPRGTITKLALAGDTMLGRLVGAHLADVAPTALFADDVVAVAHEADMFVLNLECAISDRGEPWPDRYKRFWFRAPPVAVEALAHLGVDCVTLANNHALDFGTDALLDTIRHVEAAGISCVGAGPDEASARRAVVVERGGLRVGVMGVSDHPGDFAAGPGTPGIAFANLRSATPGWLLDAVTRLAANVDVVLVTPHWGPNMVSEPVAHVRRAAVELCDAGATLIAGHSAHVFHGVAGTVLYDLGDFLDDYAVDPELRNDLGLLFLVTFDGARPCRLEAVPVAIDGCRTRLATGAERSWIGRRFRHACTALGTDVAERDGRLVVEWATP